MRLKLCLCLALLSPVQAFAQTALSIGDLSFTAINTTDPDSFGIVLWKSVDSNTVIKFTDNSFNSDAYTIGSTATGGIGGNEGFMVLTTTSTLPAGTMIRIENAGGGVSAVTLSSGAATSSGALSGLSTAGDQIFAYQGSGTGSNISGGTATETFSGTILSGVDMRSGGWLTGTTASTNASNIPKELNDAGYFGSIDISSSDDDARYAGSRTGLTAAAYRAAVGNTVNWNHDTTNTVVSTTAFVINASADLFWDRNGGLSGFGGDGTWDTTSNRFATSDDGTWFRWVDSDVNNAHTAVFGTAAGSVTIASPVTASGLKFQVSGYAIQGSTINALGTTFGIDVGASNTATISSVVAGAVGTTISKTGAGSLTLAGANTYSGLTSVSQGTLKLLNTGSISGSIKVGTSTTFDVTSFASGFTIATGRTLSGNGTVNGKTIIQGTVSPGNSIGSLSVGAEDWAGGGQYTWEVNSIPSGGTAGTNWDFLTIGGILNVTASPGSPFTIKLVSLDGGGAPGTLTGVTTNQQYTWTIATASSVTNFDPSKFTFNTDDFTTTAAGAWSIQNSGGNVVLVYSTPEPSAALLFGLPLLFTRRRSRIRG